MSYEILIQQGFWMHLSKEAISNPLCFTTSPEEPLRDCGSLSEMNVYTLNTMLTLLILRQQFLTVLQLPTLTKKKN
jgi:hypothetical protein